MEFNRGHRHPQPSDHWVSVHTLRTVSEDSILDPDDTLCDVVDDREQLVADFEEQGGPRHHHNGGDGQSVSSAGTASPEIFTSDLTNHKSDHQRGFSLDSNHDVIVTESDINSGSGLKVRRGSEPALNVLSDDEEEAGRSLKPSSKSQGDLALRQVGCSLSLRQVGYHISMRKVGCHISLRKVGCHISLKKVEGMVGADFGMGKGVWVVRTLASGISLLGVF
ncbi:hypothetical protein DPMN_064214 [Dreissena polymorpha]|uniref:Par3/HAL N-terminal domain-containing protein n=1 Tax=Dreissena polymorpha TaxID=45954 RepID=A0A9D4HKV8_DREPO|nr:hypothetical protein DPMN_064214 [Dreissena polymorpha]